MFELGQDPVILPRVEFSLFRCLEKLELKEKLKEIVVALGVGLQVDLEESLNALETLGVFALGSVVDGIASVCLVLLRQDLAHPHK